MSFRPEVNGYTASIESHTLVMRQQKRNNRRSGLIGELSQDDMNVAQGDCNNIFRHF